MVASRIRQGLVVVVLIGVATSVGAGTVEAPFLAENDAAMDRMMVAMSITPTGDVDADFVAMMVPHHQERSTWRRPCCAMAAMSSSVASPRRSS